MTRPQKDGFEFYFALDTHCKVRDYAIRNDTGEGFEQFIQRNVEGQRSGGNYPDYWLFQYTIPDDVLLRIRQQERLIGPDFLQNSLPILLEEGVAPQRIVRLRDAAFCWQMNIPYLSPEAELERLRRSTPICSGSTVTIKTRDDMPSTRFRPKHSPRKHC